MTLIMCASTFSPRNNIPQLLKWSTASRRESQHRAPEKGRHITTQIITSHKEKKQYRILTPRHAIIKAFSYLPQVTLSMDLLHPGVCSIPKFQLLTLSLANTTFNFTWLDQSGRAMVASCTNQGTRIPPAPEKKHRGTEKNGSDMTHEHYQE